MPKKQRRIKQPVVPDNILTPKIPHYLGTPNLEDRHLAWRFSNADLNGPFKCGDFTHDEFTQLWDCLRAFEKKNIAQLRKAGSFHRTPTPNLSKKAKDRLQEILLDDIDVLYSFHITGTRRLWCMRHENILSILWWDKNHEVYPTPKKYT